MNIIEINLTTVDATPTNMLADGVGKIVPPNDSLWVLKATLMARRVTGVGGLVRTYRYVLSNDGGTLTARSTAGTETDVGYGGGAALTVTPAIVSNALSFTVTGAASTTINWKLILEVQELI